jgi:urea carboxylase
VFKKVLIANRGVIACRVIRTLKEMGICSVAVYADADAESLHVQQADEAYCLGAGTAADTYLDENKLFTIVRKSGAEAVHPGYGFLSENPGFVRRCKKTGIVFIGPEPEHIEAFALKHNARQLAQDAGVPLIPGSDLLENIDAAVIAAKKISYPVMLKSTAGGGGIGMRVCVDEQALCDVFESVIRLSQNNFSNSGVFIEKYIAHARHIEVQIFGDGTGNAVALGERDCSLQRRNQKVIEETPAPNINKEVRKALHKTAIQLVSSINYVSAGTVEFIYDDQTGNFYFLEVNTRLQVEHGVTEQVFKVDLVRWMLKQAAGELDDLRFFKDYLTGRGHAIQARVYAEDPGKQFQPSAGMLSDVAFPLQTDSLRIDTWVESGVEVSPHFDPLLAKVIVHAESREQARIQLSEALAAIELYGIETNLAYLQQVLNTGEFARARIHTRWTDQFGYSAQTLEVSNGGTMTTIQDLPGRTGYWHVGVPPSGPFDRYSFALGNRLLGNAEGMPGLEITLNGPSLKFNTDTQFVITGARIEAMLEGQNVAGFQDINVKAGQTLTLGKVTGNGARSYLLIRGGLSCPEYLGSRSTFTLGRFGGHCGRALRTGDVLHINTLPPVENGHIPEMIRPTLQSRWNLRVIYGPHGAPDFFTQRDIDIFFKSDWTVHYNSSRTGIRLIGPKPEWARADGGEAGMHPSNLHDNAYAFGAVDFTGDMPVILGPDGPSLGGFVCPAVVIDADLWKLGQLKAGDVVNFQGINHDNALAIGEAQRRQLETFKTHTHEIASDEPRSCVIEKFKDSYGQDWVIRSAGDRFILVELGEHKLDLTLRLRVHLFMLKLQERKIQGVMELTPGIRSLQVHYDPHAVSCLELIRQLRETTHGLIYSDSLEVPSRIVHLPLSWDDEACQLAIKKYMLSVREDAPWCPSNLEFIRRINGLDSVEQIKDIVFNASYVVMGLGDVYLGAPVAVPVDPRHRLVTTKYNPARTWTAENSVGIGGAYLCIYGMEGPGGYQFIGRTLQMWNRYRQTREFEQPWLLRFFDQIRFFEVTAAELQQIRKDFPLGRYAITIEQSTFSLKKYQQLLTIRANSIRAFNIKRESAFAEELKRWRAEGKFHFDSSENIIDELAKEHKLPANCVAVESGVAGNIWQVLVREGDCVQAQQPLVVLESMKMEIEILAPHSGRIYAISKTEGSPVAAGQTLLVLERD